jgi:hypothetical protein
MNMGSGKKPLCRPNLRHIAILSFLILAPSLLFGDFLWFKMRNPVRDVEKTVGVKLTGEEIALVEIVMNFYYIKYGYAKDGNPIRDAAKKMTDAEYSYAIAQAAKVCMSDVAKGFYRMGKAGEKLIKAIIQTAEDAAKAAGTYIEKKSDEYDKKK